MNFAGGTARRVLNVGWEDDFTDVPIEVFDWGLDLILFVASEKGQFINGENIMIDGG